MEIGYTHTNLIITNVKISHVFGWPVVTRSISPRIDRTAFKMHFLMLLIIQKHMTVVSLT